MWWRVFGKKDEAVTRVIVRAPQAIAALGSSAALVSDNGLGNEETLKSSLADLYADVDVFKVKEEVFVEAAYFGNRFFA